MGERARFYGPAVMIGVGSMALVGAGCFALVILASLGVIPSAGLLGDWLGTDEPFSLFIGMGAGVAGGLTLVGLGGQFLSEARQEQGRRDEIGGGDGI